MSSHIIFDDVLVEYTIYQSKNLSLANNLLRIGTGGKISKESNKAPVIRALDSVSFEIKKGDAVGLLGHNGAGKSTLLRTIAGIYKPIKGNVEVQGKISTIIDLGAGIQNELNGRENILRMGLLQGHSLIDLEEKIEGIIEFSQLGNFIDMPVRTYSSGMVMRLMFAVSTAFQPDILLLDEMFSTGDKNFRNQAKERMESIINNSDIFVFASHSMEMLKNLCNRFFELEHGNLKEISDPEQYFKKQ